MGVPTPFHPRIEPLCESLQWREWAGYFAVSRYGSSHLPEYQAFRHTAGLFDASPLFKLRIRGPKAHELLDAVVVRDLSRLAPGRMAYTVWCDERGHVLDDGTVSRLGADDFRVAANSPCLGWFADRAAGYGDVSVEDESDAVAVLAMQGPQSRAILEPLVSGFDLRALRYFSLAAGRVDTVPATVSRTGFTGDLGYELWVAPERAVELWDVLAAAGAQCGLRPAGLLALDVCRVEAGFLLAGVDYTSARSALVDSQRSTPLELGFDWMVSPAKRANYPGKEAVLSQLRAGSAHTVVGLVSSWRDLEELYGAAGLPPHLPSEAWRGFRPLSDARGRQVGYASSGTWSPVLGRDLSLATVEREHARPGTRLHLEHTVDYAHRRIGVEVTPTPFFDPPRRRG